MIEPVEVVDHRGRRLEKRDPTAATNPVVYQSPGQAQIPKWDAHNALNFGFYANTFVYRCVQCIAQDLSGLRIRVGADPDKPQDFDTRLSTPLARLLGRKANPVTSSRKLVAWSIAQRLATGRFGWELELGARDLPVAFWPLPAPYLKPIPTESGARYFSKFEFGRAGEEKTLPADRVFYDWVPRADDWRQPESVLDAARYDVSVAVMSDRYDYAFLKNDARPAALVVYEGFANDDEDKAFRRDFRNDFGGPDNAGKPMFVQADAHEGSVAGSIDVKVLGLSQKDARAIERYDAKLRAITVAFCVPLSRLGDASGRTFSNASEESFTYWHDKLSLVHDLEDAWNIGLAPLFGDNVCWFDLTSVEALKAPKKFTVTEGVEMYKLGLVTGDEVREAAGEEPLGLTELVTFQPPVEVPALEQGEEQPPAPAPALPAAASVPPPSQRDADLEARARERRATAVITSTAQVNALESTWTRAFRRLFARQASETLARLNGKRGRQALRDVRGPEPDGIFNRSHWQDITEQEAQDLVEATFAAGAGRVAGAFGISFDVHAPYVQEFIRARANKLAGQVTDTTYSQITDALAKGTEAGETIREIAARVKAVFDASDLRAETIARTEVISAYNGSAATVAAQLPSDVVGGQEWITVEDARTRPEHAAADGEIVAIGEPFVNTGEPMAYPGDPSGSPGNVINCRCTVAFLTPDEMDARRARVEVRAALAAMAMIRKGQLDELALRRALREARAA